jgi:nucleotide-binding universal stress UspA family protein
VFWWCVKKTADKLLPANRAERGDIEEMNHFPTKILLATDGSEDSILAARVAAELSSTSDSELHVVHVRSTLGQAPGYYLDPYVEEADLQRLDTEAQRLLNAQVDQGEGAGGLVMQSHLKVGRPDAEIVTFAEELGVDLLVVGSRRSFSKYKTSRVKVSHLVGQR